VCCGFVFVVLFFEECLEVSAWLVGLLDELCM
jgi:hypothetical protein